VLAPVHVINVLDTPAPVQIMNVFDTNGDGEVDFQEFRDIVGKLLLPGAMMLHSAQAALRLRCGDARFYLCATLAARPRLHGEQAHS
jgi:hydroxymethylglutaryl-CoA reductase